MRILYLITQDLESPLGSGRCLPLAKCLVELGHQVQISALHSNFANIFEKELYIDGVHIRYVGQMHLRKTKDKKVFFSPQELLWITSQATWALGKAAMQFRGDIIHVFKPHPMNSIAGLLGRIWYHIPLILDCDDLEAEGNFSRKWQKKGVTYFENHMPHWVDHITTHNSYLENFLLGLGISTKKITSLPNGVDYQRFVKLSQELINSKKDQLGLLGKSVVAFIGTLSLISHPVDLLIQAFHIVNRNISDTHLLIVGGGEDIDYLKHLVDQLEMGGSVTFTGRVHPEEVNLYYQISNVIVDPVHDDPVAKSRLPLKLFESWVCGVPYVSGDIGDRSRVLGVPPAGLLVPPGEAEPLAEAIIRIINNPNVAKNLVQRGIERAKLYDWRLIVKKLEQVYLSVTPSIYKSNSS